VTSQLGLFGGNEKKEKKDAAKKVSTTKGKSKGKGNGTQAKKMEPVYKNKLPENRPVLISYAREDIFIPAEEVKHFQDVAKTQNERTGQEITELDLIRQKLYRECRWTELKSAERVSWHWERPDDLEKPADKKEGEETEKDKDADKTADGTQNKDKELLELLNAAKKLFKDETTDPEVFLKVIEAYEKKFLDEIPVDEDELAEYTKRQKAVSYAKGIADEEDFEKVKEPISSMVEEIKMDMVIYLTPVISGAKKG